MLIFAVITGMVALIIIIIFVFPQLSPIPYFPSNAKDLPLILDNLRIQDNHVVIDMGAGDGMVVFEAARHAYEKKLNT